MGTWKSKCLVNKCLLGQPETVGHRVDSGIEALAVSASTPSPCSLEMSLVQIALFWERDLYLSSSGS